jgi:osmoprotectant transport system permease protein
MNVLVEAFRWLNDPLNWTGPSGVLALGRDHLVAAGLAVLLGAAVAVPVGLVLGHRGRGAGVGVVVANTTRALPTLALLTLLASAGLFGNTATVLACAVFAVPPLLSGAVTGIGGVDPDVRDAARGMGLSGGQRLWTVEVPLAVPHLVGGLRTAAVQVLATVPLAALVGGRSLGTIVVVGFGTNRYGQVVAGAVLVAGVCLAAEGLLALVQRWVTPHALRRSGGPGSRRPTDGSADDDARHDPAPVAVPAVAGSNR